MGRLVGRWMLTAAALAATLLAYGCSTLPVTDPDFVPRHRVPFVIEGASGSHRTDAASQ